MYPKVHVFKHTGTLLQDMPFTGPRASHFFNQSPTKLIVACRDDIFLVDLSTQSTQLFIGRPLGVSYLRALALSEDDAVLVAGSFLTDSVCGYDMALRTLLWIHNTVDEVHTVCMLGTYVLATVYKYPAVLLDYCTGACW